MNLNAEEVAQIIGQPTSTWVGNCYAVAVAMLQHGVVAGEPRYGAYLGPVDPSCPVPTFRETAGTGLTRHGWILQKDGTIIDPTRWVFLGWRTPCIIVIDPDDSRQLDYDAASQSLAQALRKQTPPPSRSAGSTEAQRREVDLSLGEDALHHARTLLGDESDRPLTWAQWAWVANAPINDLEPYAREIYTALKADEENCMGALIPRDNYDDVMDRWHLDAQ